MSFLTYNGKIISLNGLSIIVPDASILPSSSMILQLDPWNVYLQYDSELDSLSIPQNSEYSVSVNGLDNPVTGITIDYNSLYLALTNDVNAGDSIFISYNGNTLKTSGGKAVSTFTDMTITNNMGSVSFAATRYDYNDSKLLLKPSGVANIDANYIAAPSAFSVLSRTVNSTSMSNSGYFMVQLNSGLTPGEDFTFSYTRPRVNFLRDSKNNVFNSCQNQGISYELTAPYDCNCQISVNPRIFNVIYGLYDNGVISTTDIPALTSFSLTDSRTGLPFANITDVSTYNLPDVGTPEYNYAYIQFTIDKDFTTDDIGQIQITYTKPETNYFKWGSGNEVIPFSVYINVFG